MLPDQLLPGGGGDINAKKQRCRTCPMPLCKTSRPLWKAPFEIATSDASNCTQHVTAVLPVISAEHTTTAPESSAQELAAVWVEGGALASGFRAGDCVIAGRLRRSDELVHSQHVDELNGT